MQEFDRQLAHLLRIGHPEIAGLDAEEFAARVEPLRKRAATMEASADGRVPFVIVVTRDLVPLEQAVPRVELRSKPGFVDIKGAQPLADFQPIEGVELPESSVYLLADVRHRQGVAERDARRGSGGDQAARALAADD